MTQQTFDFERPNTNDITRRRHNGNCGIIKQTAKRY